MERLLVAALDQANANSYFSCENNATPRRCAKQVNSKSDETVIVGLKSLDNITIGKPYRNYRSVFFCHRRRRTAEEKQGRNRREKCSNRIG